MANVTDRLSVVSVLRVVVMLAALVGATMLGTAQSSARTATNALETKNLKVVVIFNPTGGHDADLIAAIQLGYFRQEGLNVQLVLPGAPGDAQKLVATGRADIGTAHLPAILTARSQGANLIAIAARHQVGENGVFVLKKSGITSIQGLKGKTLSYTGIPENLVMFNALLGANHLSQSDVHLINAGFTGQDLLAKGRVDGNADAFISFEPLLVHIALNKPLLNPDYRFFSYVKNGVPNYYPYTFFTSSSFAQTHPNTLKAFLRAWSKGMKFMQQHPQRAVNLVVKAYPATKRAFAAAEIKALLPYTRSSAIQTHCRGWMQPSVWTKFAKFLNARHFYSRPVSGSKAFTDKFLPCAGR